jgi:hypothetical protein
VSRASLCPFSACITASATTRSQRSDGVSGLVGDRFRPVWSAGDAEMHAFGENQGRSGRPTTSASALR